MGSVKELLTNAYDPILEKEVNLLEEDHMTLRLKEHSCNSAVIIYLKVISDARKLSNEVDEFKQLVQKARQLKKDEDN